MPPSFIRVLFISWVFLWHLQTSRAANEGSRSARKPMPCFCSPSIFRKRSRRSTCGSATVRTPLTRRSSFEALSPDPHSPSSISCDLLFLRCTFFQKKRPRSTALVSRYGHCFFRAVTPSACKLSSFSTKMFGGAGPCPERGLRHGARPIPRARSCGVPDHQLPTTF